MVFDFVVIVECFLDGDSVNRWVRITEIIKEIDV